MAERALSHNIVTLADVMHLGGDYETYSLSDLRFRTPGPYKLEHLAVHLRGEDHALDGCVLVVLTKLDGSTVILERHVRSCHDCISFEGDVEGIVINPNIYDPLVVIHDCTGFYHSVHAWYVYSVGPRYVPK